MAAAVAAARQHARWRVAALTCKHKLAPVLVATAVQRRERAATLWPAADADANVQGQRVGLARGWVVKGLPLVQVARQSQRALGGLERGALDVWEGALFDGEDDEEGVP